MAKGGADALHDEYNRLTTLLATLVKSMSDISEQARKLGVDPKIFKELQKAIDETDAAQKKAYKAVLQYLKDNPSGNMRSPPGRG